MCIRDRFIYRFFCFLVTYSRFQLSAHIIQMCIRDSLPAVHRKGCFCMLPACLPALSHAGLQDRASAQESGSHHGCCPEAISGSDSRNSLHLLQFSAYHKSPEALPGKKQDVYKRQTEGFTDLTDTKWNLLTGCSLYVLEVYKNTLCCLRS